MIIIERFEGCMAVLETDEGRKELDRACLPEEAREGDVLCYSDGVFTVDCEATDARSAEIRGKLGRLIRRRND